MNQYEVFNAGRFAAYSKWYGTLDFGKQLATSTAVDPRSDDLVVHVLAAKQPGQLIENPRQKSAYHYSRCYGPMPPSFSRATFLKNIVDPAQDLMLVAGTASVVGEVTQHVGDLQGQIKETCTNLSHLLSLMNRDDEGHDVNGSLMQFRELRIYYCRESDADAVTRAFTEAFSSVDHIELMGADLCRADLLVEVEAMATRSPRNAAKP